MGIREGACALLLSAAVAAQAAAPDVRAVARGVLEKQGGTIVTVRLVLKRRVVVQGQERGSSEMQSEIFGTVISSTGLTVVSDSASNPWAMYASDSDSSKIDTDTTDVKLLLDDGREIPARFVLRDHDLDLAFIQPEMGDVKLPYLSLEGARVPKPLDDLIFIYRAGKILNREVCVALSSVQAIVHKPRTFIVSDWLNSTAALGGPVFDGTGALLGIVVLRRTPGGANDRVQNPMRFLFDMLTPVVLTLPDLRAVTDDATRAAAKTAKP
jgi:hypothetical protein